MGSALPTPYQGSCLILHTSQRAALPAGCPATLASARLASPASPCICAECLYPVLKKTSQHIIAALPLSFVTPSQHLNISQCISIALGYYRCAGSSVLALSQCFSALLDAFLSTFRSLLPCFPPPPILHKTFPDPLLCVPYCAPSRDSLHRKARLFARDVLEGMG